MPLFVKRAKTGQEIEEAAQLVHASYIEKGYFAKDRNFADTLDDFCNSAVILVGVDESGRVENTLSLMAKPYWALPMSEIFSDELSLIGGPLVEMRRFASISNCWDTLRLMRVALREAHGLGGDTIVATTHPDHKKFYHGFLGFECLANGEVRHYRDVCGNPAIGFAKSIFHLACHRVFAVA